MRDVFVGTVQGGTQLAQVLRQPVAHRQLRSLAAKLSLHILNRFCNQAETQEDLARALRNEDKPQGTHRMTYTEAVFTLLENYMTIFLIPNAFLSKCGLCLFLGYLLTMSFRILAFSHPSSSGNSICRIKSLFA
jgi:hypothetical protein